MKVLPLPSWLSWVWTIGVAIALFFILRVCNTKVVWTVRSQSISLYQNRRI